LAKPQKIFPHICHVKLSCQASIDELWICKQSLLLIRACDGTLYHHAGIFHFQFFIIIS